MVSDAHGLCSAILFYFGDCMHACIGIPLLYMILVVPLGFLVNTEHTIGSHYGHRDANGRLMW